jgi:hypothetical protein
LKREQEERWAAGYTRSWLKAVRPMCAVKVGTVYPDWLIRQLWHPIVEQSFPTQAVQPLGYGNVVMHVNHGVREDIVRFYRRKL